MARPAPTHGRFRPCDVVYRWQASNGRRLRDARCPVHGAPLDRTCLGLMKSATVVDREPLFGLPPIEQVEPQVAMSSLLAPRAPQPTQEELEAAFDLAEPAVAGRLPLT